MACVQRRLRILIVENDALLMLAAEAMVRDLGHEVCGWASSAERAIAEADRQRPDVVLMDIQLDGQGDGIDAAREIKGRLGIVSLFMTGAADPETRRRALSTGPLGYLQKPFTRLDLEQALDALRVAALPRSPLPPIVAPPIPGSEAGTVPLAAVQKPGCLK